MAYRIITGTFSAAALLVLFASLPAHAADTMLDKPLSSKELGKTSGMGMDVNIVLSDAGFVSENWDEEEFPYAGIIPPEAFEAGQPYPDISTGGAVGESMGQLGEATGQVGSQVSDTVNSAVLGLFGGNN